MDQHFTRYLQTTLFLLDILVLNAVNFIFQFIFAEGIVKNLFDSYVYFYAVSNGFWVLLSFLLRTYAEKTILNFGEFTKRTVQVYLIWVISVMFYLYFSRELEISRLFIVASIGMFGVGLLINRFIYLGIHHYFRNSDFVRKNVLILGYNETAKKLTQYFEKDGLNLKLFGYLDYEQNVQELSNYPVLASVDDTLEIARKLNVHEIFSTIIPDQSNGIYQIMRQAEKECIRFKIVPDLNVFLPREVHVEYFGDLPILSLRSEPLDDVWNRIKKRTLDILISSFTILFILSWLIPILGLIIWLESGRPILFRQLRTGKNNKPFYCLKLRSMKPNKDADKKQATVNDNRVTRFGKFLRKTSFDELPQFFNVLKGEMSLVGPRPHMERHTSDYSKLVDEYMVRQFIKPGITGWAQVNGYRGEITNPEEIQMRVTKDLWYLENWTLWLDIQILFLTIYYVFRGDNKAY